MLDTSAIVIMTGAPGAGKSTVARLVAGQLPRAALLNGDTLVEMTVSGAVWALGEPAEEAARQVRLTNQNLCDLAGNYADADFVAVIDWIIPNRDQLDFFVDRLAPRPVHLVVLAPTTTVSRHRNEGRDETERWEFDGYRELLADMKTGFSSQGWWFDTSQLTAEATATAVIAHAAERARIS